MHENFCIQHVKKCQICGEVINIEEEEEHIEENHSQKKCEICQEEFEANEYFKHLPICKKNEECIYCKKEFRPSEILKHQKECDFNLYECKFCFGSFPIKDKYEHEIFCGSKTEKCEKCGQYVILKKMELHNSAGCFPEEIPIASQIDVNNIPVKKRPNSKIGVMGKIKIIFYLFDI